MRYKEKNKAAVVPVAAVDKNMGKWLVERQTLADRVRAHQVVVLDKVGKRKLVPERLEQMMDKSMAAAGLEPVVRSNPDTALESMEWQMWLSRMEVRLELWIQKEPYSRTERNTLRTAVSILQVLKSAEVDPEQLVALKGVVAGTVDNMQSSLGQQLLMVFRVLLQEDRGEADTPDWQQARLGTAECTAGTAQRRVLQQQQPDQLMERVWLGSPGWIVRKRNKWSPRLRMGTV